MLNVEDALQRILDSISVLEAEQKPLIECLDQVLAEDIVAQLNIPPKDNSAMDGYAVQVLSIAGASSEHPQILRVIGELAAGTVTKFRLESGTAIRIMTGAIIPDGADTVVPFEDTDEQNRKNPDTKSEIGICKELKAGSNIRKCGEDVTCGELVIKKGKVLNSADIGLLASLGKSKVMVIRRPVVGILATGNEVVDIDVEQPLPPGKIYNSNSYSIAAQVISCGGIPRFLGIAPDDKIKLTLALCTALDCDLLLTSGGVSVGDYDMVKEVLSAEGNISFWAVRMKPGKPLAFGNFKRRNGSTVPHLGLPGNPVSSMVTFEIFARPTILKMMGRTDFSRSSLNAILESTIKNNDGRRIFTRVFVEKKGREYYAHLTGEQGSGILTSMVKANGLAIIPETVTEVKHGTNVKVLILNWDGLL